MPYLLMMVIMIVVMMVSMGLRTGGVFHPSTAGLAVVTAAILPQNNTPPQVARQLVQLFMQRHALIEVGEELAKRLFRHTLS